MRPRTKNPCPLINLLAAFTSLPSATSPTRCARWVVEECFQNAKTHIGHFASSGTIPLVSESGDDRGSYR